MNATHTLSRTGQPAIVSLALRRARQAQALLMPLCLSVLALAGWWAARDLGTQSQIPASEYARARSIAFATVEPAFDVLAFDAPIARSAHAGPSNSAPSTCAQDTVSAQLLAISQDPDGVLRAHLHDMQLDESFTLTAGQSWRGLRAESVRSDGVTLAQGELMLHLSLEIDSTARPRGAP